MKMKKIIIMIAIIMLMSVSAYGEQKLINITEDTIPEDSYRPVAGKEFLVAVKLVDVDSELNNENPISNEPIIFQTSIGSLSETEVVTNIYGEAITWLTTDTMPDTNHSITATVKDKPEVAAITIQVKDIALPQDTPTTEELISAVDATADKIQDIMADIQVTSNAPWEGPTRQLKIWEKGEKQKVQEISPNPKTTVRPEISTTNLPELTKDIVAYNQVSNTYVVKYRQNTQMDVFPFDMDCIDPIKGIIISKASYLKNNNTVIKMITEDSDFTLMNNIWVFQKEEQKAYNGVGELQYTTVYQYSNIQINTGIPDSEFSQ
jgi:outer membrane lipoprotein-sorting protein